MENPSTPETTSHPSILDATVSCFQGVGTTVITHTSLRDILTAIRTGTYQKLVDQLRAIPRAKDEPRYKRLKEKLPSFTPASDLTTRESEKFAPWAEKLLSCSGVIGLDFDHLSSPETIKRLLAQDKHCCYAFISPGGEGVKVGFAGDGIDGPESYKRSWQAVAEYLTDTYPDVVFKTDRTVSAVNSLCFVSHDPDLYQCEHPIYFPAVSPPAPRPSPTRAYRPPLGSTDTDRARVENALAAIANNDAQRETWLTIGMALHSSGESWSRELWDSWSGQSQKFNERVQDSTWRNFTPKPGGKTIATLFGLAKDYGWDPRQAAREALVTQFAADYPDAAPIIPFLEAQARQPNVKTVLNAAVLLAELDSETFSAARTMLRKLLRGELSLKALDKRVQLARRDVAGSAGARQYVQDDTNEGEPPPREDWERALKRKKDNEPEPILRNILDVLNHHEAWHGVFGFNEFTERAVVRSRPPYAPQDDNIPWHVQQVTDTDDTLTNDWLQRHYALTGSTGLVAESIQAVAHATPFHPVRDYLQGLTWDGIPRIDRWLERYANTTPPAGTLPAAELAQQMLYQRTVGAKSLIAAVARILQPGCQCDSMTILEGSQGVGKSSLWRALAVKDEWFFDGLRDIGSKDADEALIGKWLCEFGELSILSRTEVEQIKQYISKRENEFRLPYARRSSIHKRTNIFVGSTNNFTWAKDPTGNRRFWPIRVYGEADLDGIIRDRDQLWGEAVTRYRQGEAWHLSKELEAIAQQEQAVRLEADDWEARILDWLDTPINKRFDVNKRQYTTTVELLTEALDILKSTDHTTLGTKRLGGLLRRNGWTPDRVRPHEKAPQIRAWIAPETSEKPKKPETPETVDPFLLSQYNSHKINAETPETSETADSINIRESKEKCTCEETEEEREVSPHVQDSKEGREKEREIYTPNGNIGNSTVSGVSGTERSSEPLVKTPQNAETAAFNAAVSAHVSSVFAVSASDRHVVTAETGQEQREDLSLWSPSELARKRLVEAGATVLAHAYKDARLITWAEAHGVYLYIGREHPRLGLTGSDWQNPFVMTDESQRQTVIRQFEAYFEQQTALKGRLPELQGKVLGCFCFPRPCHGDVLVRYLQQNQRGDRRPDSKLFSLAASATHICPQCSSADTILSALGRRQICHACQHSWEV